MNGTIPRQFLAVNQIRDAGSTQVTDFLDKLGTRVKGRLQLENTTPQSRKERFPFGKNIFNRARKASFQTCRTASLERSFPSRSADLQVWKEAFFFDMTASKRQKKASFLD
jgi:hypothetical protein